MVERASSGDERAAARLVPVVYDELRRIARGYLRQEAGFQTIQATALVHEAYLRLAKHKKQDWHGRTHFLAVAAIAMRQILVDRARGKATAKRAGSRFRVTFNEALVADDGEPPEVEALDAALTRLARTAPQRARIVELRFFGGLTIEETADALAVSPATVKRGWTLARAWLRREMREGRAGGS